MVSFTSTSVIAFAAITLIQQAAAGGVISGIFGKRSLEVERRDNAAIWSRASTLEQSFNACFATAKEELVVTRAGPAAFKLAAKDGSFPEPCIVVANSYISTSQFDGKLVDNKDGSYTLHPKAADVAGVEKLVHN